MYWVVAQSRQEVAPTYLPSLSETRRSKCPRPSTFRILLHLETEGTDYPMTWRRVTEEQNRRNEFVAFKFEMNWKLCLIPVLRGERLEEHSVSGSFFFFPIWGSGWRFRMSLWAARDCATHIVRLSQALVCVKRFIHYFWRHVFSYGYIFHAGYSYDLHRPILNAFLMNWDSTILVVINLIHNNIH